MADLTITQQFAQALQQKFIAAQEAKNAAILEADPKAFVSTAVYEFGVEQGSKYDRITQKRSTDMYGGSVHAFVERSTGKLIKAAGWKAPAKRSNGELQSQFNIGTAAGFKGALDAADLHGGYLYIR